MNHVSRQPITAGALASVNDALWTTYRWMTLGLGVTGLVALGVASSPAAIGLIVSSPFIFFGLVIAQLGLVVAFSAAARRAGTATVAAMFLVYAALTSPPERSPGSPRWGTSRRRTSARSGASRSSR